MVLVYSIIALQEDKEEEVYISKSLCQKITTRCWVAGARKTRRACSSKRITPLCITIRPEYTNYQYTILTPQLRWYRHQQPAPTVAPVTDFKYRNVLSQSIGIVGTPAFCQIV
jgi:hypothetical protein